MSEARQTVVFGGVAVVLVLLAWATAPRVTTPAVFADRGPLLFLQFTEPNAATSLEVIEFDAERGAVRPFKVQNRDGRWTIPSQHDHPADAQDRLAQTAAAIIALRKDDFASDSAADHERCGVLDPLDATLPALQGRGTRLIVRGQHDQVLADIIVGKPAEGHDAFRYVRSPDQKRVYLSRVGDLRISTAFGDWIERDLLQLTDEDVDAINLRYYSVDEKTSRVSPSEVLLLQKKGDERWTLNGVTASESVDEGAVDLLIQHLAGLRIVGVLPKPPGITATLSRAITSATLAAEDRADLARKGFYLASNGQLLSNEGEVVVRTRKGLFYTLRFGEVASGTDMAAADPTPPAAAHETATSRPAPRENRYLFIMVDFSSSAASSPGRSTEGAAKVAPLRARFAPWYYVISADSFAKIRLQRKDLVKTTRPATAPRQPAQ